MSDQARVAAELPLLIADVFEAAGAVRAHGQHLAAQGLSLTDLLTTRSVLRHLIAATTPAAAKPPRRR